jgi:enediyne biosynthesis protein E4
VPKYHRNALLLNTGTGGLRGRLPRGDRRHRLDVVARFEDLDNDGRLDLFVTNGFPRDPGADTQRRMMQRRDFGGADRIMYDEPPSGSRGTWRCATWATCGSRT